MTKKLTIQDMHRLAETRGGRCLSAVYADSRSKLLWECAEGHQWTATPNNVQQGGWCADCAGLRKLTIDQMQQLAATKGGECLSGTYIDNRTPLLWECREGHRWKATPSNIKRGKWCPVCAGHSKPSMDRIKDLARERGGKCLSQAYRNALSPMNWECIEGHQWKARWNDIQQGQWCPICSAGLGERICREFFSQLLGESFPKARPEWLVNKAGNQMELDGYSETLRIAFEHQGEQHYSTNVHFLYNTEFDLSRRQEDDALKSELCAQRGITLVAVPQITKRLPVDQVKAFIKKQLAAKGISLPHDFDTREVDINRAYRTGGSREALDLLRTIAMEHGGQCLSMSYVRNDAKLLWECAQGHKWEATPGNVKQGHWCPYCAGMGKTIEDMRRLAAAKGGRCLSEEYANPSTHLLWQCKEGHKWKAKPSNIKSGKWCPFCAGFGMKDLAAQHGGQCLSEVYKGMSARLLWQCAAGHKWETSPNGVQQGRWCPQCARSKQGHSRRLGMSAMQAIAANRGGLCLSDEYVNSSAHLLWQCSRGHQWKASPANIKGGTWCPHCSKNAKLTIEDVHRLAEMRGGRCLSDKYVNANTRLLWQCNEGHQWQAVPNSVKQGHWCPVCAVKTRAQTRHKAR
jgi:hypothetical protein